jgi:hypothetical protein
MSAGLVIPNQGHLTPHKAFFNSPVKIPPTNILIKISILLGGDRQ